MKILAFVLLTAVLFASGAASANEQTVTLNVANATCELCGPIVKRSLNRVSGVLDVQMSETNGAAVARVRFEDSRTSVPVLITATTNAGYPASIAQ